MKTFNLAIVTLAFAAAASTSAFAESMDSNGNIPNHHGDTVTGYSDSVDGYYNSGMFVDRSGGNGAGLSANDRTILQLRTNGDADARDRS